MSTKRPGETWYTCRYILHYKNLIFVQQLHVPWNSSEWFWKQENEKFSLRSFYDILKISNLEKNIS